MPAGRRSGTGFQFIQRCARRQNAQLTQRIKAEQIIVARDEARRLGGESTAPIMTPTTRSWRVTCTGWRCALPSSWPKWVLASLAVMVSMENSAAR
ncbi:MAG: hypothetical protein IPP18_08570 [Rhodocyclaceae bacterium]|nr:hypothetical protein [Rhodocyclaceae bacterium]